MPSQRHLTPEARGRAHILRANKDAALFRFRHMNDTKWREVLALLREPECSIKRLPFRV